MHKILIVEDDVDLLRALEVRLSSSGYRVVAAVDGVQGTIAARREKPDLVILDLGLPGGDGFELLPRLRSLVPTAPVIVLTAADPNSVEARAREEGATDFLQKPADNDVLLAAMNSALAGTVH